MVGLRKEGQDREITACQEWWRGRSLKNHDKTEKGVILHHLIVKPFSLQCNMSPTAQDTSRISTESSEPSDYSTIKEVSHSLEYLKGLINVAEIQEYLRQLELEETKVDADLDDLLAEREELEATLDKLEVLEYVNYSKNMTPSGTGLFSSLAFQTLTPTYSIFLDHSLEVCKTNQRRWYRSLATPRGLLRISVLRCASWTWNNRAYSWLSDMSMIFKSSSSVSLGSSGRWSNWTMRTLPDIYTRR